jgi:hypothetical protein
LAATGALPTPLADYAARVLAYLSLRSPPEEGETVNGVAEVPAGPATAAVPTEVLPADG